MQESIIKALKKYDEICALVLDQKIDAVMESGQLDEFVENGEDVMSGEEALISAVMADANEEIEAIQDLEMEELDGESMREWFLGISIDELMEILEYCATEIDNDAPASLYEALVVASEKDDDSYRKIQMMCAKTIGDAAWVEEELKDEDKLFEMEFKKVNYALILLAKLKDASFVEAVLDRFTEYAMTHEFVADSIRQYIVSFPTVSRDAIIARLEAHKDDGLTGPYEDLAIMLTNIGEELKCEEIYLALKTCFRYMENKVYAVICLAEYGDGRAIPMLKGYINRNQHSIERDLFYEILSAVQHLGGDISDIEDPFGDFDGKNDNGGMNFPYRKE